MPTKCDAYINVNKHINPNTHRSFLNDWSSVIEHPTSDARNVIPDVISNVFIWFSL
jgi:hypothetical protein